MVGESFPSVLSSPSVGTLIGLADAAAIIVLFSKVSALESRVEENAAANFTGGGMFSGRSPPSSTRAILQAPLMMEARGEIHRGEHMHRGEEEIPLTPILKDALSRVSALERGFASIMKRTDDLEKAVMLIAHHMKESPSTQSLGTTSPQSMRFLPPAPPTSSVVVSPGHHQGRDTPPTEALVDLGW